ncbi:MAG: TetR family transcriptional regulator [Spirochaetota bacterium]
MQMRSEETRTKIAAEAQRLFSLQGYNVTSVSEICKKAGVSKGAFYHHFPSKHAVFLIILENWLKDLETHLNIIRDTVQDASIGLVQMAAITKEVFAAATRDQFQMFLEFWSQAVRDPGIWQASIAPYRRFNTLFAGIVKKGIEDKSLRPIDLDLGARVIMAFAVGLIFEGLLDPEGAAGDKVAQEGMQLLMILVTGATGHIGNVVVRELLQTGAQVRALVLPGEDCTAIDDLPVEIMMGDILKPSTLSEIFLRVSKVFHL